MCTCPKAILDWTYILFICVQCLNPTINIAITKPALFINFIYCSQMRLCVKELWLNNASSLIPADYVSSPHGRSSLSTQRSILYVHCTMSFLQTPSQQSDTKQRLQKSSTCIVFRSRSRHCLRKLLTVKSNPSFFSLLEFVRR